MTLDARRPDEAKARMGDYELLVELASGGMATAFLARRIGDLGFERLVVVKRVHPHLLKNSDFSAMVRDEARVASKIQHANVVPVIDVVEHEGELALVLEYVESVSLRDLASAAGEAAPLPPSVVARIVADLLAGLHAAHEAVDLLGQPLEVIHRDVSPQNVLVGSDGTSRLIDFGIAKAAARIGVTNSGVMKGKLSYMSPEQAKQRPIDRRADLFAAGVVLYEALTGRPLFRGDDEGDIVLAVLVGEIPAVSTLRPEVHPALDRVVAKALERDPDERFQTASEFQQALESALPPAPARDVASLVARHAGGDLERRREELRQRVARTHAEPASVAEPRARGRSTALVAVGAALVVALGLLSMRNTGGTRPETATSDAATLAVTMAGVAVRAEAATSEAEDTDPPPDAADPLPRPPRAGGPVRRGGRSELRENPYGRR